MLLSWDSQISQTISSYLSEVSTEWALCTWKLSVKLNSVNMVRMCHWISGLQNQIWTLFCLLIKLSLLWLHYMNPHIYYEIKSIKYFIKDFVFFTVVLIWRFITFCWNSFGGSSFFFPMHHHFSCMEQQFQEIGRGFVIFASLAMFIFLTPVSSFLNITLCFGHCPMVCIHHSAISLTMATKRCCKYFV